MREKRFAQPVCVCYTGPVPLPTALTLADIEDLANWAIDEHLSDLDGDWHFAWDRAKKRLGACHFGGRRLRKGGEGPSAMTWVKPKITLSKPLFSIPENTHDVLDTILHEIAHALAGPLENHGAEWKRICVEIGARPTPCYESDKVVAVAPRYVAACSGDCDHRWHRKPKYERYTCLATGETIVPVPNTKEK